LLEESFDSFYLKHALIDYTVDFMNYDSSINWGFNWWIDPSQPISLPINRSEIYYEATPIKVIKPHGSLNWKYCNCCNKVLLTHWQNQVNLDTINFSSSEKKDDYTIICPYDQTEYNQLIIPPTHYKRFNNRVIQNLLQNAINEMKIAKKICFIGYSFPDSDLHIKSIIDRANIKDKEIYCVNNYIDDRLTYNFDVIANSTIFINKTIEEFILSDEFLDVLSPNIP